MDAGADRDVVTPAIEELAFGDWVATETDRASQDGVTGTPSTMIDGAKADFVVPTEQQLQGAIEAAG